MGQRQRPERRPHQGAAHHQEAEGAADVGRPRLGAAAAHPGVVDHLALIAARSREPEPQRPRHRRLGPAGVGRAVAGRVLEQGAKGVFCVAAQRCRREAQEGAREPRRDQVDGVVEARRGPAELGVGGVAVADHAVGGVDCLVGGEPRQAEEGVPERRRHHAVGEVLGAGLDGGAAHRRLIQGLGIAAHDMGDGPAPGAEAAALERPGHRRHVVVKAALGNERAGERRLHQPAQGVCAGAPGEDEGDRARHHRHQHQGEGAAGPPRRRARRRPVEAPLERRHQPAHGRRRMGQATVEPAGIAERGIEGQRQQQHPERADAAPAVEGRGEQHGPSMGGRRAGVNRPARPWAHP